MHWWRSPRASSSPLKNERVIKLARFDKSAGLLTPLVSPLSAYRADGWRGYDCRSMVYQQGSKLAEGAGELTAAVARHRDQG